MKLKLIVLSAVVIGAMFFLNKKNNLDTKSGQELLIAKGQPYEELLFQRSFPNEKLNIKAQNKAYKKALEDKLQKTNSNTSWTQQGPTNIGGRLNCVTIDPQNENIVYVGCSTGGVFRTLDGGASWASIADELDYLAVSSIVLDPNDNNVIYVGTGDHNITGIPHIGNGIYKSSDGGSSWTHLGLTEQRIVSRISINPNNTQIIYAATMGLPFERNNDRGLYKSIDGGATWTQSLFVSDEAGIIDMVMDPLHPDTLFASSWNRIRNNSESLVHGPDANIYRTYDGGANWIIVENGLSIANGNSASRVGLEMSGEHPGKVFTMVVDTNYQLDMIASLEIGSDDWDVIPYDYDMMSNVLGGFGWYFGQIRVNPSDDNEITILGVDMYSTFDNGDIWFRSTPPWWEYSVHADKHDMQYSNGNVYLATDGGLYKADESFSGWEDIDEIPNTQFYRVAVNPHNPGYYTGGAQDNGTTTGRIGESWVRDYGGDGFQAIYDPQNPNLMYAETQNGSLNYMYLDEGFWNSCDFGITGVEKKNWDMPWILSTHDNTHMYTGAQSVFQMNNAPMGNWHPISEDLTSGLSSGGRQHTISTVAESPLNEDLLYVGETGGFVWRTDDQGDNWTLITSDLPTRYVKDIKASPYAENTVYVTLSGFKDNDNEAHIYKSDDRGDSWQSVSGDMGDFPVNNIEILSDSSLVVATDVGVYSTANYGVNWERVGNNMPIIPVYDIAIDEEEGQLVAGTFARSLMTFPLDSLSLAPIATSNDPVSTTKVNIYPNPSSEFISLEIKGNYDYEIFALNGERVLKASNVSDRQKIDVHKLTQGLYIIKAKIGKKLYIGQFMKQ